MNNILWISFMATWTVPLLTAIKKQHKGRLGIIVPALKEKERYCNIAGIDYYYLKITKRQLYTKMNITVFRKYEKIIKQFSPDIIHVHGTEKNIAQLQNFLKEIPVVISIQGIMMSYKPFAYNFLNINRLIKYKSLKNTVGIGGTKSMYNLFVNAYKYETDILENGKYFIGRTEWDKANICMRNNSAMYFHGEELLRDEFYKAAASWSINNCIKYTILMPGGFNPVKGLHIAIEAMYYLTKFYPQAKLIVPDIINSKIKNNKLFERLIGDEYVIYVKGLIKKYQLENNIVLCERFDSTEMAKRMQAAHVFLSPTSIDNSPNTLGEATMIGVPVVTTAVGGILSILEDKKNCLFVPAGDSILMAMKLKELFDNDKLAERISKNCIELASKRHNIITTSNAYLDIYNQILKNT